MNAYFEKNEKKISNNRIYNSYFQTEAKAHLGVRTLLNAALALLLSLLTRLSSTRARVFIRVTSVALSLVGFIGVIGAVEHGSLTMLGGLLIGAILIGVEYLALRGSKKSHS